MKKSDSDLPIRPPIDFDPPSNGEFVPLPPTEVGRRRLELWRSLVEQKHRRLGLSRREFAESACGMAACLFVINQIACDGSGGGAASPDGGALPGDAAGYDVHPDMMDDMARAREALAGNEFVFDVQTHVVNPETPWSGPVPDRILTFMKLIFVDSDTTVACLSGVPGTRSAGLMSPQGRAQLQELVERYGGSRLLFHCNIEPQRAGEAEYMMEAAAMYRNIAAWKSYPQNNPGGLGADAVVGSILEAARKTGIRIVASHRGLGAEPGNHPLDVVQAAKKAPDLKFLVYHAGYQAGGNENLPYDPAAPTASLTGINRLIRALEETQTPPGSNVYAELGTTWNSIKNDPQAAAHALGKLLKYVGEDNVLYGTDCVMSGSPQPQIVALRMLTIPPAFQQQFGYPALTDAIKRKILGENGARVYGIDPAKMRYAIKDDDIAGLRMALRDDPRSVPMPDRRRFEGPRTRRQLFAFLRREQQNRGALFGS